MAGVTISFGRRTWLECLRDYFTSDLDRPDSSEVSEHTADFRCLRFADPRGSARRSPRKSAVSPVCHFQNAPAIRAASSLSAVFRLPP